MFVMSCLVPWGQCCWHCSLDSQLMNYHSKAFFPQDCGDSPSTADQPSAERLAGEFLKLVPPEFLWNLSHFEQLELSANSPLIQPVLSGRNLALAGHPQLRREEVGCDIASNLGEVDLWAQVQPEPGR